MLKEEQNRFNLIEKAIEESKKEIVSTREEIQVVKLELQKEILGVKKDIEILLVDIVDKINSSNRWVIGTIVIG